MAYRWTDLTRLGKELQGGQMLKALYLQQDGQPWDLPEYQPLIQGMRTQGTRGLQDLSNYYRQSGMSGPSAALGMERAEESLLQDPILNLVNQMRQGIGEEAWRGGESANQIYRNLLAAHAQSAQEKQQSFANKMAIAKMIGSGISGGISGMSTESSGGIMNLLKMIGMG